MNLTNLWDRAIERSVFARSVDGAPEAMRQAVRPFGQPRSAPPRPCPVWRGARGSFRPQQGRAPGVRGSRIRRPVRSLRRHARAVACVVLGLAGVASATPAAAQSLSDYERVSNVDVDPGRPVLPAPYVRSDLDHSQRFTTGSYSRGYTLTNVAIGTEHGVYIYSPACTGSEDFLTNCPVLDTFSVSVCRVLISGYPDRDSCTLLTPPSSFEPGFLPFLSPKVADPFGIDVEKIELAPNTTYTLLTEANTVEDRLAIVTYGVTDSDNEDTDSSPGWSIWNDYDSYNSSDDSWGPHYAQALRVQISATKGHSTAVITSVDVTSSSSHPPLYGTGDIIEFTVTLSDRVTVEGDPVFLFSLGGVEKEASYDAERSTARILVFRYTVLDGDEDTDGIWVGNGPGTFRLDGDDRICTLRSLQDSLLDQDCTLRNSQDALLDHDALGTLSDLKVAPTAVQTLVSNFGQPSRTWQPSVDGGNEYLAQRFTTGSNSAGYGLASIRINVLRVYHEPTRFIASIWTTDAQGRPQTKQFDLTGPASITTTGNKTFTAPPNTTLNASTTYAFVFTTDADGTLGLDAASRAEDGAPGWSIANNALRKIGSAWYTLVDGSLRVEVKGTILTDPTDATLSALGLSDASDHSSIALSPPFASSTTSYTASVPSGVDAITIAPTTNDTGASLRRGIAYLDDSDTAMPDADTTRHGQQVSLEVGANTIKVKVTSGDGTTTQTYTVTVTRTPSSAQARVTEAEVTEAEVTEAEVTEAEVTEAEVTEAEAAVIEAEATVTSTPQLTSDTYGVGETIVFTVTFSEAVKVEGDPVFRFSLGNAGLTQGVARVAAYDAGQSMATKLVFKYTVQTGDEDTDGIWIGNGPGTFRLDEDDHIRLTSNKATATLTHSQLGILTGHKVDGSPPPPPPPPPPTGTVTGRSGPTTGGSSGGGGGSPSQDDHGNTATQATPVALSATRTASVPGQLNPAADVDYFSVDLPHAGVVVVETTGSTATVGTVWQAGEELATADRGGTGQNFWLSVRVAPGPVVIAVAGNGRQTGAYTLHVTFVPGFLENPGAASFQSGIGVISGWTCAADEVEIVLNGEPQEAGYGTERLDTAGVCGDTDNGFGLLFNWNLLGDGEHEVVAYVDGVELGRATVTVTTLGVEFLRGAEGECVVEDFPAMGRTVTLEWQQTSQNFVIAGGSAPARANTGTRPSGLTGYLENPGPNSFQSGIGVISGWVCEADTVELAIGAAGRQAAAYGTERADTLAVCGDTDNGFGLLFNWNLLGDGAHAVVAYVDGMELGRATVRVTTLGVEFLRDVEGECVVEDFPMLGETVLLEWQQNSQNFVITDVE